jgi:lipoate---protein ligase
MSSPSSRSSSGWLGTAEPDRGPPVTPRRFGSDWMRLLDLGTAPWIRSQSVHHAVAQCFDDTTPDTLVVVRPDASYVSVGNHGVGAPLSPAAVRRQGLPVLRRRLGGGTVLITPAQTFYVLVVHRRRLPLPDARALAWCLGAAVAAYRRLGVAAEAGPATDVCAAGRKLCGSGAATVGEAAVFGGNILADFDPEPLLAVLRFPSAAARQAVGEEMRAQMGSVRLATGVTPDPGAVGGALRAAVEEACATRLVPGLLSRAEESALPAVERWLRCRPPVTPPRPAACWKVRAGCGVVRLVPSRPRGTAALATVRAGVVVAVTAERREGRHLAACLEAALAGRALDAPVDAGTLEDAGIPGAAAVEVVRGLDEARRRIC